MYTEHLFALTVERDARRRRVLCWRLLGLNGMLWRDGAWIRLRPRGRGLSVKRRATYRPLFAERHAGRPAHHWGPIVWRVLTTY